MIKKIILSFLVIFSLNNCGYVPSYKNINDTSFGINISNTIGNRDINNLLILNLNNYLNVQRDKTFDIQISTILTKESIAKDSSGKTTDYQIKIKSTFNINFEGKGNTINLTETFDYKSIDDQFKQEKYENTIKENISKIMTQKLVSQLSRIK